MNLNCLIFSFGRQALIFAYKVAGLTVLFPTWFRPSCYFSTRYPLSNLLILQSFSITDLYNKNIMGKSLMFLNLSFFWLELDFIFFRRLILEFSRSVSLPFFQCQFFLITNFPARYITYQNHYYRGKSYIVFMFR